MFDIAMKDENVYVSKWIPQKQLLNHDKAKIFLTHGGYTSVIESIEATIAMLVFPL